MHMFRKVLILVFVTFFSVFYVVHNINICLNYCFTQIFMLPINCSSFKQCWNPLCCWLNLQDLVMVADTERHWPREIVKGRLCQSFFLTIFSLFWRFYMKFFVDWANFFSLHSVFHSVPILTRTVPCFVSLMWLQWPFYGQVGLSLEELHSCVMMYEHGLCRTKYKAITEMFSLALSRARQMFRR